MTRALTVNMVGCGRVGRVLGRLLTTTGAATVQDVLTRSMASAQAAVGQMGAGRAVAKLDDMREADVWILGVSDQQINSTAQTLAQHCIRLQTQHNGQPPQAQPLIALHLSGALASTELSPLSEAPLHWKIASVHPVLSFADHALALQQFAGTPVALEGSPEALDLLGPLFERLGGRCFQIEAPHKMRYHAAAVFASNFLPVIQQTALDLWATSGVPPEVIQTLWPRMLQNASHNTLTLGPVKALTGPAARGDTALVQAQHASLAQWHPEVAKAYAALSALASEMATKNAPSQT